jgi:hypothetical protein
MGKLGSKLPLWVERQFYIRSKLPLRVKYQLYRGTARFCPICETNLSRFLPGGFILRPEAYCPICGSLERHRLIWMYFRQRTDLFASCQKRMLHLAPEPFFTIRLQQHPYINYVSGDLFSRDVMINLDLTKIPYPDRCFDVIYASHVLEHIPDDQIAMKELVRVLKPDGWAILQVPIDMTREVTYEDFSIVTPAEREKAFGQPNHVRIYGRDYRERLKKAGFCVKVDDLTGTLSQAEVKRFGLIEAEDIYFCTTQ